MHSHTQSPERGSLVLPLAITGFLFIAALAFGVWAFIGMLDYKNNVDTKVAAQVVVAKQVEDRVKDAAFAEAEKQPLKTYNGPTAYGSVSVSFPKTWSGYVADTRTSSPYVDGYFYPGVVPDTQAASSVYALRIQVIQNSYSNELNSLSSTVKQGLTTVKPYTAPKVPNVIGSRVDGRLNGTRSGSMILIPLRNMTLKIWTEAPQFQADFDNNILPNFTFAP